MSNDELQQFLKITAAKLDPNIDFKTATMQIAESIQGISNAINTYVKSIDWNLLFDSMRTFADMLASIPDDVKKTVLFQEIDKFSKCKEYELTYENIEWFLEELREQVLIESPSKDLHTDLTDYIENIKVNSSIEKREKVTVLLSHIEPLIWETLNHEKQPHEKIKNKVQEITVANNKGMSAESLAKVYVYGICSIVFANTDNFDIPIDKRIPFRNNILHNGVMSYSDEEIETVYEILTDFMDALVVMKHWMPATGENVTNAGIEE